MPDRTRLRVGDRIRLLAVPKSDLAQRRRELQNGQEDAGWTADTLERILAQDPVVTISFLDEYDTAWFDYELVHGSGDVELHSLAIMDNESWQYA